MYTQSQLQIMGSALVEREIHHCASVLISDLAQNEYNGDWADELMELTCGQPIQRAVEDQFRYVVDLNERGIFKATLYPIDEEGDDSKEAGSISLETAEDWEEITENYDGELTCPSFALEYFSDLDVIPPYAEVLVAGEDAEMEDSDEYTEIFEHWIVSDWLGNKLTEEGELVVEFMGFTIWGRTTTGQSIALDSVIQRLGGEYCKYAIEE